MSRRLIIAVSGTPGTGKSAFAEELARKLGAMVVNLNDIIIEKGIYKLDEDGTRVVDPRDLQEEFACNVERSHDPIVVEGLLAHLLPKRYLTHVVVLRTRPKILERRLRSRGYSSVKLRENVEAEALGIILWEAVNEHGTEGVFEIDTTELDIPSAVRLFTDAMEGKASLRPGKIDWLEETF